MTLHSESIVQILVTKSPFDYAHPWQKKATTTSSGSGAIVAANRILTNAHVVSDGTFIKIRRAGTSAKYKATVEFISHDADLALLKVEDDSFFAGTIPLEFSPLPEIGDQVTAYGFPMGGSKITLTEGIVSRIDFIVYAHAWKWNLVCQTDAAISKGISGGPVLSSDDKIVGIAFQNNASDKNIGYIIPTQVIQQFIDDTKDGKVHGLPVLPCNGSHLENSQIREFYKMTSAMSGVRLSDIAPPRFQKAGLILPGDILLAIDGHDIANDGTIELRPRERISLLYTLVNKQLGDIVKLDLLREGKVITRSLKLDVSKSGRYLVPPMEFGAVPSYYIIAGYVFSPLTANYCRQSGNTELRKYLTELIAPANQHRKEVIVLIDTYHDDINDGFSFKNEIVSSVNGKKISAMGDLVAAFEENQEKFHLIQFETTTSEIAIHRQTATDKSQSILEKYRIPKDRSEDLPQKESILSSPSNLADCYPNKGNVNTKCRGGRETNSLY